MSRPPQTGPMYLEVEGIEPVFAYLHMPTRDADRELAVLIVPPFGWEESCSYRSRRDWALDLAGASHPTLRIDLPGTGDSGESPHDPGRLDAWSDAIVASAKWLRTIGGVDRVAAIGIGVGGLLVAHAIAMDAAIDEIALWAVPSRGRTFIRELRAFGLMEASKSNAHGEEGPLSLAGGAIGVGGFMLGAEAAKALETLDTTALLFPRGTIARALLLERDGISVDERLRAHLEESGAEVAVRPGPGFAAMMAVPHEAQPPDAVFAQTRAWLAAGEGSRRARAQAPVSPGAARVRAAHARHSVEIQVPGSRVRETPLSIDQPFGHLFGVLAEPVATPARGLSAILLNPGAHRRIGQGRMWVEAARRWAAGGVATLRLDLEGIGDSDGDAARFADMGTLYTDAMVDQVLVALGALDARGLGPRYVLGGLCSGAYWSFHAALRDERVAAALMLNPQTLFWDRSQQTARVIRQGLRSASTRRKVLRGEVPVGELARVAARTPALVLRRARAQLPLRRRGADRLSRALDALCDAGTAVDFMFSGGEPLLEELEREGRLAHLEDWPNVSLHFLPGRDHILRPVEAQLYAHEVLDRALARELARVRSEGQRVGDRRTEISGAAASPITVAAFRSYE